MGLAAKVQRTHQPADASAPPNAIVGNQQNPCSAFVGILPIARVARAEKQSFADLKLSRLGIQRECHVTLKHVREYINRR